MINTEKLSLEAIIVQSQGNVVSDMDGEKVMMSIKRGKYFNLGVVGGAIWDGIESPVSIKNLINSLISQFDIENNECSEQVMQFIDHLLREDLIKIVV